MFTLPNLPYPTDALEPYLDKQTMEIHHGKHHAAYTENFNKALAPYPDLQNLPAEKLLADRAAAIPLPVRQTVINHGGGYVNHNLYWTILGPKCGGEPQGELASAINTHFGSFANLKDKMIDAGLKQFGSGWSWLVKTGGKLEVYSTLNQDSPLSDGKTPLFVIDVWEHAYYLKYQNRRGDFLKAVWNVVNWTEVARRFKA